MGLYIDRTELFHVHTFRCGHAENVPDEAYIEKAAELGASGIIFTDHIPFPGNDIAYRMNVEQLPEYLDTLHSLKEKYSGIISVRVGLEAEYFPLFHDWYEEVRENPLVEFIIIGQHAYEVAPGKYSFQLEPGKKEKVEYIGCGEAMVRAIETGMFDIVAHPDRIFTGQKEWSKEMESLSRMIIDAACRAEMKLEINLESVRRVDSFWREFWELVPENADIVVGADSHSVDDMILKWEMQKEFYEMA